MALSDNLVAYWSLDETSGNRADSVGSNDLVPSNAPSYATGLQGNAVDLERSSSQRLSVPSWGPVTGSDPWSFFCWVNPESFGTTLGDEGVIVEWGNNGNGQRATLRETDSGKLRFEIGGTGQTTALQLSTSSWQFVGVTFDGTNFGGLTVYLDSSSEAMSGTAALNITVSDETDEFSVGVRRHLLDRYWDGLVDELGVWSRELSSAEVAELYNSGVGRDYAYITGGSSFQPAWAINATAIAL